MTTAKEYVTFTLKQEAESAALGQEAAQAAQAADKAAKVADDSIEALLSALQKACPAVAIDALTARKLSKEAQQKAKDATAAWVKALGPQRPFMSSPTQTK
jgi:hypothetical protein